MRFSKKLDIIMESVIDISRNTLDPRIFDNHNADRESKIKPEIIDWLKNIVSEINNKHIIVHEAIIKGSILSYQWVDKCDIDLLLEVCETTTEAEINIIWDQINEKFNGLLIPGTAHPLQIYLHIGKYNHQNADGIYDLDKGWIKGPYDLEVNVSKYMNGFSSIVNNLDVNTGKLKRDLIDYNTLNKLDYKDLRGIKVKLYDKLKEISNDVEKLIIDRQKIKNARRLAFEKELTPEQVREFGSKNLLPNNVIFKLLERYHYLKLLDDVSEIYQSGNRTKNKITDLKTNDLSDVVFKKPLAEQNKFYSMLLLEDDPHFTLLEKSIDNVLKSDSIPQLESNLLKMFNADEQFRQRFNERLSRTILGKFEQLTMASERWIDEIDEHIARRLKGFFNYHSEGRHEWGSTPEMDDKAIAKSAEQSGVLSACTFIADILGTHSQNVHGLVSRYVDRIMEECLDKEIEISEKLCVEFLKGAYNGKDGEKVNFNLADVSDEVQSRNSNPSTEDVFYAIGTLVAPFMSNEDFINLDRMLKGVLDRV